MIINSCKLNSFALFFFFALFDGVRGVNSEKEFVVVDKDTHRPIANCKLIEITGDRKDDKTLSFSNSLGKVVLRKPEGLYRIGFVTPFYQECDKSVAIPGNSSYRIELTSIDTINAIKERTEKLIQSKSLMAKFRINRELSRLDTIYRENGFPDMYDNFKNDLDKKLKN